MLSVTARKRRLCAELLTDSGAAVTLADVGSGGPLKRPWSLLPSARVRKVDFEPTDAAKGDQPLCVSNREGEATFYVARDQRASSFHKASPEFATRYGMGSLFHTHAITVRCITLDQHFAGRLDSVDALDVNVEGHDLQVLQGGLQLLQQGSLKLLKVEFELAAVWQGQGWLSDIDPLLRGCGYELAGIDIDFARPVSVQHCFHRGEPLWGKALYVPGAQRWQKMLAALSGEPRAVERARAKGLALYVAADLPARALELLSLCPPQDARNCAPLADLSARVTGVYRWAKLERGAADLFWLAARAVGVRRGFSGA